MTNPKQDMYVTLRPVVPGYDVPDYVVLGYPGTAPIAVPGYVVSHAGCSKVPACAFPPGKEASDDGYLRGPPIGSGEGGTNVGKGLLVAYVSIAKVV